LLSGVLVRQAHAVDHPAPQHRFVGGGVAGLVEKAEIPLRRDAGGEVAFAAEALEAVRNGDGARARRRLGLREDWGPRRDGEREEREMAGAEHREDRRKRAPRRAPRPREKKPIPSTQCGEYA